MGQNVTGVHKILFNLRMKIAVFFHFISELFKGSISLKNFFLFIRRLLIFLSRMQHNKFVKIGQYTRIDLYVPGFPSKAFYTACKKFMKFNERMPCATVLLSVTSACRYNCNHCYQKRDKGKDVDIDALINVAKKLQEMGVAFFNIEGGDPFLVFDRLKKLCFSIDNRSEIWINSTGMGVTKERLMELKKAPVTAIMFSLHSPEPKSFNQFMGNESAWQTLEEAIQICHEVGMPVAFNTCLMPNDFYNGTFEKIMDRAKDFGVCLVQIIKPKPAGGWLEKTDIEFTDVDILNVKKMINNYNTAKKYSDYPAISAQIIEEDKSVFGCTAGGVDRFYINAKGDVQPCEFLNLSFGNIMLEPFESIFTRMRNCFAWGGDCMLCERYSQEILNLYKNNKLSSLPLPPEISKEIYGVWDRGGKTDLYQRLERLK